MRRAVGVTGEKEPERSECCLVIRQIEPVTWFKRKFLTIRQEEVVADPSARSGQAKNTESVSSQENLEKFLDGKANEGSQ